MCLRSLWQHTWYILWSAFSNVLFSKLCLEVRSTSAATIWNPQISEQEWQIKKLAYLVYSSTNVVLTWGSTAQRHVLIGTAACSIHLPALPVLIACLSWFQPINCEIGYSVSEVFDCVVWQRLSHFSSQNSPKRSCHLCVYNLLLWRLMAWVWVYLQDACVSFFVMAPHLMHLLD
jgi:hypothetical protein